MINTQQKLFLNLCAWKIWAAVVTKKRAANTAASGREGQYVHMLSGSVTAVLGQYVST